MTENQYEETSKDVINNWNNNEISVLLEGVERHWKFLMRFIDVKEEVILNICANNSSSTINQQAVLVLEDKLNSSEDYLTWETVENALIILRRNDVIKTIKKHIPSLSNGNHSQGEKFLFQSTIWKINPFAVIALDVAPYWKSILDKLNINDIDKEGLKRVIKEDNEGYPEEEKAYQCFIKLDKQCENGLSLEEIQNAIKKNEVMSEYYRQHILKNLQTIFFADNGLLKKDEQVHDIKTKWDFVMITHSTKSEIENLEKEIDCFDENFKELMKKNMEICQGGGKKKRINMLEFYTSESAKYVQRYYGELDFFCFNYDSESNEMIGKCFKSCLHNKILDSSGAGFMIKDYNLMKHFNFLKMKECVSDYHFSKFTSSHKMDYIGVEEIHKAIYFIKKSNATTLKYLMQEIKDSAAYVRMFTLLHKKKLVDKISCLLPLIVIPTESEHLIGEINEICSSCGDFIITEEKFQQIDELDVLLNELVESRINEYEVWEKLSQNEFENFKYDIADIFGFMASEDVDLIPCLSDDVSKQIDNSKLLFSPKQLELSNLKDRRVFLIGSYGSGKTLVARSVLKKLSFSLEQHTFIHYINFGSSSDLTKDMNKFVESLPNKKQVICQSMDDGKDGGKLNRRLKSLKKSHANDVKIHLVFDEVSVNDWSEVEVLEFVEILSEPQFIDSHCLIICQPMDKKRSFTQDGITFNHSFTKQIQTLITQCGFKKKKMDEIFRNTNKIEKLAKHAKDILENHKNKFHEDIIKKKSSSVEIIANTVENESKIPNIILNTIEHEGKMLKRPSSYEQKDPYTDEINQSLEMSHSNEEINKPSEERNAGSNKAENTPISTSNSNFSSTGNLDVRLKLVNKSRENKSDNKAFLESSFTYCYDGKALHSIDGPDPLLYFPFDSKDDYQDFEKIYLISLCFKNIIQMKKIKKITIIHFEDGIPNVLEHSLQVLKESRKIEFKDLTIKTFTETQGCEYSHVIIYLSTAEYHLRHYLVEAITRCNCLLIFVVVKDNWSVSKEEVVWKIVQKWEAVGLVKKVPIKRLKHDESLYHLVQEKFGKLKNLPVPTRTEYLNIEFIYRFCSLLQSSTEPVVEKSDEDMIFSQSSLLNAAAEVQWIEEERNIIRLKFEDNKELSSDSSDISDSEDEREVYPMDGSPCGKCLIINNNFEGQSIVKPRVGSDVDAKNLSKVFEYLNFEIEVLENLKGEELWEVLTNEMMDKNKQEHNAFVLCILTYGKCDTLYSYDASECRVQDVIDMFADKNCQYLKGKPKFFFIQSCHMHVNAENNMKYGGINEAEDQIVWFGSSPDSFRSAESGTWFIKTICRWLKKYSHKNFYDTCLILSREIEKKRNNTDEEVIFKVFGESKLRGPIRFHTK